MVLSLRDELRSSDSRFTPFTPGPLTLHTEGSRRPAEQQPRYIVLMCLDPGAAGDSSQTILTPIEQVVSGRRQTTCRYSSGRARRSSRGPLHSSAVKAARFACPSETSARSRTCWNPLMIRYRCRGPDEPGDRLLCGTPGSWHKMATRGHYRDRQPPVDARPHRHGTAKRAPPPPPAAADSVGVNPLSSGGVTPLFELGWEPRDVELPAEASELARQKRLKAADDGSARMSVDPGPNADFIDLFERAANPEDPKELLKLFLSRVESRVASGPVPGRESLADSWRAARRKRTVTAEEVMASPSSVMLVKGLFNAYFRDDLYGALRRDDTIILSSGSVDEELYGLPAHAGLHRVRRSARLVRLLRFTWPDAAARHSPATKPRA